MKKNSAFATTCLWDLSKSLTATYGNDKGGKIFNSAESILCEEFLRVNDRSNKMIGRHIRRNILPGFACYRAMLDAGICGPEAVEFVRTQLCRSAERMERLCKRLSSKKYAYGLIRIIIGGALKYGYPKQGWTVAILENNKERIRFDITSCLYCEELQERGALELCPAFCDTDVVSYGPLAPAVIFKREGTLAQTGVKCDFCFENGTISK